MSDFEKNKELARQQIFDLKCSVCQDVPGHSGTRKNRYVCPNGHMVCELCKVQECICKSKSYNGPVKYIENLLEKLSFHCCCHFKQGCQDVFETQCLEDHQKCCIYREINCIFDTCKKELVFKDVFDHFEACHQDEILNNATKMDENTFNVSFDSSERAKIKFEILNFTRLSEPKFSKIVWLQNVPWNIRISIEGNDKEKFMGYFLKCDVKEDQSCQAKAELRLINHKDPNETFKLEISHLFTTQEIDWGFKQYMLWTNVTDAEKGFIKDNTVTVEVKLVADLPTGNIFC